jgi:hypothetical protein
MAGLESIFRAQMLEILLQHNRHIAATQSSGRFRGEADIDRQTKPAGSADFDS